MSIQAFIDNMTKTDEQKKKEADALAANAKISTQDILDFVATATRGGAYASPTSAPPDIQLPTSSRPSSAPEPQRVDPSPVYQSVSPSPVYQSVSPQPYQPVPQAPKLEEVLDIPGEEATKSLYNQKALQEYITKSRANGVVPEFTNIKGEKGFFVNSISPPPPSAVDGKLTDIKEPFSYKDLQSIVRDTSELKHSIQNQITSKLQEISEEEGVTKLEKQMTDLIAAGWQQSPVGESVNAQLQAARIRAAGRLSLDKNGMPMGTEATPFIAARQMLDNYAIRIKELGEGKEEEAELVKLQIATGISPEVLNTMKSMGMDTSLVGIGTTSPDNVALATKISEGKKLDLGEVIANYPDATPHYVDYIKKNRPDDQAATITSTAKVWAIRLDKAGEAAAGRLMKDEESVQGAAFAAAKKSGDNNTAKSILDTVVTTARIEELANAKLEMEASWVTPDRLDPGKLIGVTEAQRETAIKIKDALIKHYGSSLPTSWVDRLALNGYLLEEGIDTNANPQELVRRMMANLKAEFNNSYKDTIGAAITSESPQFKFWGL